MIARAADRAMDPDEETTRRLVLAAQDGDAGAREELLLKHMDRLRAFVRLRSDQRLRLRESESDLVQSVCGEILRTWTASSTATRRASGPGSSHWR